MKQQLLSLGLTLVLANSVHAIAVAPAEKDLSLEPQDNAENKQPANLIVPASRGELLYLNHCQGCHESGLHIREKQKAKTINAIRSEVSRWEKELQLKWTLHDIEDVVEFLNYRYYHHQD
jgi:cytochrome c5